MHIHLSLPHAAGTTTLIDPENFGEFDIQVTGSSVVEHVDRALRVDETGYVAPNGQGFVHLQALRRLGAAQGGGRGTTGSTVSCKSHERMGGGTRRASRSRRTSTGRCLVI